MLQVPARLELKEIEKKTAKYRFRLFFIIVLGLLPGGCLSAPRLTSPSTPWIPSSEVRKPDEVWNVLRVRNYDFSKPLTLAQVTDIALQNNPACSKAWNDAMAAAAAAEQARSYLMPTLTGVFFENQQKTTATPAKYDSNSTKYGPGLQLNYLALNFGGGRGAAVEQALQTVYAANYTFNKSLSDVLLSVETAYYGVISAQAFVEAAESSLKDLEKTLDAAKQRFDQKVGTALDVLQAQAGCDNALYNLANAQGMVKISLGALALAMGVPSYVEIKLAPPSTEIPPSLSALNLRDLIDGALARRPDISALRATLSAREAAVKVAGSGLWPSLYLNGSLGKNYYTGTTANPMQDNDLSYSAGISLQWTFFDGLLTVSARHAAEAQAESARAQLRQAELAASVDVWSRYQNYETAIQKYKFSEAFQKSANASHEMALESYNSGLKSMLDLLDAEAKLSQARTQNVAARQEVFTALALLAYSTGWLENGGSIKAHSSIVNSTGKDTQK